MENKLQQMSQNSDIWRSRKIMEIVRMGRQKEGPILAECTNTNMKDSINLEKKSDLSVKDSQMARRKDFLTR